MLTMITQGFWWYIMLLKHRSKKSLCPYGSDDDDDIPLRFDRALQLKSLFDWWADWSSLRFDHACVFWRFGVLHGLVVIMPVFHRSCSQDICMSRLCMILSIDSVIQQCGSFVCIFLSQTHGAMWEAVRVLLKNKAVCYVYISLHYVARVWTTNLHLSRFRLLHKEHEFILLQFCVHMVADIGYIGRW